MEPQEDAEENRSVKGPGAAPVGTRTWMQKQNTEVPSKKCGVARRLLLGL